MNETLDVIESRTTLPLTLEDIDLAETAMRKQMKAVAGPIVICADHSQVPVLPGHLADRLADVFRGHNTAIERSAILVASASAVCSLQVERIVAESGKRADAAFGWRATQSRG